ncbi:MAG: GNAT family N-acetyltransferase [Pseudomonadota bacterium]
MSIQIIDNGHAELDLEKIKEFMADSPWQSGIGEETLNRAIQHSICFSAISENKHVGFARVVTDKATFAWIDDVYVDSTFRRQGIAKKLIEAIINHAQLNSVASWFLSSSNPEARRVFNTFGFEPLAEERSKKLMARPKIQNESYRT